MSTLSLLPYPGAAPATHVIQCRVLKSSRSKKGGHWGAAIKQAKLLRSGRKINFGQSKQQKPKTLFNRVSRELLYLQADQSKLDKEIEKLRSDMKDKMSKLSKIEGTTDMASAFRLTSM